MNAPAPQPPEAYPDAATVALLAEREVQAGLFDAAYAIDMLRIERTGCSLPLPRNLAYGITQDGTCVNVALTGEQDPSQPDDYSVFVYHLAEVVLPGFAKTLTPRKTTKVERARATTTLHIEDPARFSTIYHLELDSEGRDRVAGTEQQPGIQTIDLQPGRTYFERTLIRTVEEATLGDRRRAIALAAMQPLLDAAGRHDNVLDSGLLWTVAARNCAQEIADHNPGNTAARDLLAQAEQELQASVARAEAASRRLRTAAAAIMDTALSKPDAMDQSGLVHNPDEAYELAHAAQPHMDKAGRSWFQFRKRTHQRRAQTAMKLAGVAYDRSLRGESF